MTSIERAEEIFNLVRTYGREKVSKKLNLKEDTIRRYCDIYKLSQKVDSECQMKILLFDIETAPSKAYVWNMWQENTNRDKLIKDGYVLCYAAKWLNSDGMMVDALPFYNDYKSNTEYDYHVVRSLYNLLNSADIVIGHNVRRFDMSVLRTRALYYDLKPLSHTKEIDTLQIAKSLFKFPSNRLDAIGDYLDIGRKVQHEGFNLWRKCLESDLKAWDKMIEYNEGDVHLLEKVYLKLRAWDKRHPNVSVFTSGNRCNVCGSEKITQNGNSWTNLSVFESYQCDDCGHWNRGRVNIKTKEQMKRTLLNG